MNIIQLKINQANLVADLFNKYRIFYEQASDLDKGRKYLEERLQNNEALVFLAKNQEDVPVGFALLYAKFSSVDALTNWHLGDLYVDKTAREKGLGKQLLETVIAFAKAEKALFLSLNTAQDNHNAKRLYEATGFVQQYPFDGFYHYKYKF